MKKVYLLSLSVLVFISVSGQNVGIGTSSPNAAALLHVNIGASNTRGILVDGVYNPTATVPNLGASSRMMFYPGKAAFRAGRVEGTQWNDVNVGIYSVATGQNTIASGNYSSAMGYYTQATNDHANAMGNFSIASGQSSTAMGDYTVASGEYSTAMGLGSVASGNNSTAMGQLTTASGDRSTAFGYNTIANAFHSTAMGQYTVANGQTSIAMGSGTRASGQSSTAMGASTKASGTHSTVTGLFNIAKGYSSMAIGMYNDSLLATDQGSVNSTTPLFIVGNGDGISERSNAMVVEKNGNVMIGDSTPHSTAQLQVEVKNSLTKGLLVNGNFMGGSTVPDLGAGSRMMYYPGKSAFRAGVVENDEWNNSNVGSYSFAAGRNTIASNTGAIAMGYQTIASGGWSTAFGVETVAGGNHSTALGNNTIAKGFASTVIGVYNDSLHNFNELAVTSNTKLFIVGNGSHPNQRSNALVVQKNGNVMIGDSVAYPDAQLHVEIKTNAAKGFIVNGKFNAFSSFPSLLPGSRMMYFPGRAAFRAGGVDGAQWNNGMVGDYSFASGSNTIASGNYSIAMGNSTEATGDNSIAMGQGSKAFGNHSVSFGFSTLANGEASFAMGEGSLANAAESMAIGSNTKASGGISSAFGRYTIAKGYASTVIGQYNDTLLLADQIAGSNSLTPLFIVGNGTGTGVGQRSNAMVVYKNGDTEIDNLKILKVGGGTTVSKQQLGETVAGDNPGVSGFKTYTLFFPSTFASVPKIIATAKNDPGFANVNDSFVISIRSITSTQVVFNIQRVDANSGWSQQLRIEWMAWE